MYGNKRLCFIPVAVSISATKSVLVWDQEDAQVDLGSFGGVVRVFMLMYNRSTPSLSYSILIVDIRSSKLGTCEILPIGSGDALGLIG